MKKLLAFLILLSLTVAEAEMSQPGSVVPIYRMTIEGSTAKAINYQSIKDPTKIGFRGTILSPESGGEALIKNNQGAVSINARFHHLKPASKFGSQYLTYVLWAISPEGRGTNLGEIILDDGEGRLQVTTQLQSFGLLVTAEPYFAVTQVSNIVILENVTLKGTKGNIQEIDAKYELMPRGQYAQYVAPTDLAAVKVDKKMPFHLFQARNAVNIARWAGAEDYAPEVYRKAETYLQQAEVAQKGKRSQRKEVPMLAKEAVQTAEDARLIAIKRSEEAQLQSERQSAAMEVMKAKEETGTEVQKRAQSEREKMELRAKLRDQLNVILETRDTARGLILNLSDVLFESGKHTLKPEMREKLAKVSGIILAYPGLKLEVEGHTDNVGSESYNQRLSERRASTVREYLVNQGISANSITAKGLGKSLPVDLNSTQEGRQRNRRVEIIVSGDLIGENVGTLK